MIPKSYILFQELKKIVQSFKQIHIFDQFQDWNTLSALILKGLSRITISLDKFLNRLTIGRIVIFSTFYEKGLANQNQIQSKILK